MRHLLWFLILGLVGCGFKDLPKMKSESEQALRHVMIQYRLRADIVPQLVQLVEARRDGQWPKLVEQLKRAHGQALSVDLPLQQLNEKQLNRVASFQHNLSRTLTEFTGALEKDAKLAKSPEYGAAKEQLGRAELKIAEARQKYLALAPTFNEKLSTVPHKWFNAFVYKFEPALLIQ